MNQTFYVDENSTNGASIGTVIASDQDVGQTLVYSILSWNTYGAFTINALTGALSVANAKALNSDFSLVVKVQDNGTGNLSSQADITINILIVGIEITRYNKAIKVYPNPVADVLTIETGENQDRQSFEIINSTGQIVLQGNLSGKTVVQITNLSPGIYLIKFRNGRSFEFKKILKIGRQD